MNQYIIIALIFTFSVLFILVVFFKRQNRKHRYNRKVSKKILVKINGFKFEGQKIQYIRKINPFVFEELLLDAFEQNGYEIKRNDRYTGDNGIDGVMFKDGVKYIVQAKRYKGHINLKHLKDFSELTRKQGCKGFFCHTGKTGKASKEYNSNLQNITMISGSDLLNLLKINKFS